MRSSSNKKSHHRRKPGTAAVFRRRIVAVSIFAGFLILAVAMLVKGRPKGPEVAVKKFMNGHYQLMVLGRPYIVKGVCHNPIPIGQSHEYDWCSDPYKPWLIDGKLMKEMGINTVRIYQPGDNPDSMRQVIRDLYGKFGIRVALGHWLGFWEYPCPLYGQKEFRNRIKAEVSAMVENYKNEPGVLCWIMGNENNYSCLGTVNAWSTDEVDQVSDLQKRRVMLSRIYYSLVNELADEIHKIDPNHPVALGNGELVGLETAKDVCPSVDMIACIVYRGKTFGNLFKSLKATFDKPVMFSEFGADAYDALLKKEDQNQQAFFLDSQWRQIFENLAGDPAGQGNCLGGTMFEWTDEWWKHNPPDQESWSVHDTESNWSNGQYYFDINAPKNMNMNEEWFGLVALSPDQKEGGLDKRIPRKAYYVIRDFWKNPKRSPKLKPPANKGDEKRPKVRGMKISDD